MCSLPFLGQQISLPRGVERTLRRRSNLRRLLGYEIDPAASAFDWRVGGWQAMRVETLWAWHSH